ncbi:CopA family copper-resistance protein [Arcticibacter tournemirensis]|nr:multicopper oxidase domain-containing protein [Arcticibacter tournemirensis]TQM49556.1 CopA family copper-resistance protein [Arcticibacter tournemirensis]
MGLVPYASAHGWHISSPQQKQQPVIYTCPMHPEIQSAKPGNCPKCGMKLVAQKKTSVQPKKAAPTKKSPPAKMNGQSGKNMPMQKQAAATPSTAVTYTCPMHPEIHTSEPGNCPKCGMKLVKVTTKTTPGEHHGMEMQMETETKQGITGDMNGMHTKDDNATMENIKKAKLQLGNIKTVSSKTPPKTVRYDLYVADTTVTYGKKSKRAIAVNGQIPMPTLTFTEGDTALIYVHNNLDEETSLHWHGLFVPNQMDGVPFLTQMPIKPHSTYIYKFPIVQHGTHWYHSHTKLQEQIGMYGAFIMNKRADEWDIPTVPVVISEWTDMNPEEVHRSLRMATDWFAIQKGATQSYAEAIKTGHFKTKVNNEWKRMNAMDVSDVYYDTFLINGKNQNEQPQFRAGDKVRLRIANAGASDYFWLKYAGGKITVVATDGNDVEPVEVDRLIIAVSETYDVMVTIPENKSYEFLVTPEDRTKSASLWLGKGEKVPAGAMPRLKYFAGMKMMNEMMDMNGNMIEMEGMKMQNQIMDMNTVMYPEITGEELQESANKKTDTSGAKMPTGMDMGNGTPDIVTLNYNMLRDPKKTTLSKGPWKEMKFELTGNMNRYVWTLDNKTVSESDKILIKKGENVRIILFNNSMMRHPMHLHGHDFRVLNDQGEHAPMKNIIDIMPMERDTIEFAANEPGGDWFFHCHILYHMMSGMGRVFSYENSPANPEITNTKVATRGLNSDEKAFHPMATIGLESNGSDGEFMLSNTRYRLSTEWRIGLKAHHGNESETYFGKYIGKMQWLFPFIGFDYHYNGMSNESENNLFGQISNQNNRKAAVIGFQYILPMLVTAEARLDSKGKLRFQLGREDVPVTSRLRLNFMGNTDKEYMAGLRYIVTKYFSFSTHYDSDMGYGGGITITY